jgi:hypothetical protein
MTTLYIITAFLWSIYALEQGKIMCKNHNVDFRLDKKILTVVANFIFCPLAIIIAILQGNILIGINK